MSHRTLKSFLSFLLLSSLLIISVSQPIIAGDIPGQGEIAVVGKINVGDVVEVQRDGVPLREGAGTSYKEKRTLNKGETWIVQGGPISAEGLTWWYVSIPPPYVELEYTNYGWVAEVGKDGILNLKEQTNNNPPSKPTNQEPPNGATSVSLTPTLRASAFSDPDGDSHLMTWWEIIKVADDSVVWDSGWRTYDLTSTTVPSGILQPNTKYKWRVRYMDSKGAWSSVSDFTQFTTEGIDNPPKVDAFDVQPRQVKLGDPFTISYTVSDDKGLSRVELWRAEDSGGSPVNWQKIKEASVSGTKYSDSFSDAPTSKGSYWYGIHVVDTKGQWSTEPSSIKVVVDTEQELQIVESFKVTVTQGGSAEGTIKVFNPNDKDHKILANSFVITDYAGFKGDIYATNLGSDLIVPAKGYATIEIKVEADAECPEGTYYPKYKIRSDV
jgi:hypothetical protein